MQIISSQVLIPKFCSVQRFPSALFQPELPCKIDHNVTSRPPPPGTVVAFLFVIKTLSQLLGDLFEILSSPWSMASLGMMLSCFFLLVPFPSDYIDTWIHFHLTRVHFSQMHIPLNSFFLPTFQFQPSSFSLYFCVGSDHSLKQLADVS